MKARLLYGLCLLLMLTACNKNKLLHPKPSGILTSDQLIPLLVDLHLTDASLKLNESSPQSGEIKLFYAEAFAPVFKKYETTPAVFENSMKWYSRNIDVLALIYTEVITRLSTLEAETRIKVNPGSPGGEENNPFYPFHSAKKSAYLPDIIKTVQVPYAYYGK